MPPRVKRALLGVICAVVLFAQHIALSHAVWHAVQQLPVQGQEDRFGSNRPDRPYAPELSKLCVFDAAFGQVLGGAPTTSHSFSAIACGTETAVHEHCSFTAADLLAPRSRGPPSLL